MPESRDMGETTEHIAGPMLEDGTQPCIRCGELLSDYRRTMVRDGTQPLRGWAPGVAIYRYGNGTSIVAFTHVIRSCRSR